MRPDDRRAAFDDLLDPGVDLPFDADLESLHDELSAAGQHARRMLSGRTQPTRLFSNQLRAHLQGAATPATRDPGTAATPHDVAVAVGHAERVSSARDAAPPASERVAGRANLALAPRTILALLAIASMAGVLALGAISGTFGPPLP